MHSLLLCNVTSCIWSFVLSQTLEKMCKTTFKGKLFQNVDLFPTLEELTLTEKPDRRWICYWLTHSTCNLFFFPSLPFPLLNTDRPRNGHWRPCPKSQQTLPSHTPPQDHQGSLSGAAEETRVPGLCGSRCRSCRLAGSPEAQVGQRQVEGLPAPATSQRSLLLLA